MCSLQWQNVCTVINMRLYLLNVILYRADSRFAPSQWETALLCNDVSRWLGASLKSARIYAFPFQNLCASFSTHTYLAVHSMHTKTCSIVWIGVDKCFYCNSWCSCRIYIWTSVPEAVALSITLPWINLQSSILNWISPEVRVST